jgi:hypothetical protein
MNTINIANSAARDAVVSLESVRIPAKIRWVDERSRPAAAVRVLKEPLHVSFEALSKTFGEPEPVGQAIREGDPEIDFGLVGMCLADTSRVYVDSESKVTHRVSLFDIVRSPDGAERERRPSVMLDANIATETPLRWSNVMIKKDEARRKFVIVSKRQLVHVNGLTYDFYDFLFGMARELEEKESLMLLGAGPRSNQPLVFRRGGSPYRGLLEGRTQGDRYCLLLHLTNLELKAPSDEGAKP